MVFPFPYHTLPHLNIKSIYFNLEITITGHYFRRLLFLVVLFIYLILVKALNEFLLNSITVPFIHFV